MTDRLPMRLFGAGVLLSAVLAPSAALACGGFFCMNQPMDQSGERIFFIQDGGDVQAHVKINFVGEAKDFSWVVPTPTKPKLEVGSDALFRQLDQATAPQFQLSMKTLGDCPPPAYPAPSAVQRMGRAEEGVQIVSQKRVGPYDSAVIQSNDPAALKKWLRKNGYELPKKLDPLLDPYVAGKYYFVALKLQQDRSAGDLQPIVMKYKATKPGVPIRLTGVAATPDMDVFVWVLGDTRAIPENYRHATINEARINWLSGGSNYRRVVTRAANEAGGQAFVTDYAGDTQKVDLSMFRGDRMDTERLARLTDPVAFLRAIQTDGYFESGSPAALAFVRRYVPIPKSMKDVWEPGFYSNPEQYKVQLAKAGVKVKAAKAAKELEETVVAPYREIMRQFGKHAYLTRMYTTMSPEEMTQDPTFRFTHVMPDVSNIHTATGVKDCRKVKNWYSAPVKITLKNGHTFTVTPGPGGPDSDAGPRDMPYALRIEQLKEGGASSLIQDNSGTIAAALNPAPETHQSRAGESLAAALAALGLLGWFGFRRKK